MKSATHLLRIVLTALLLTLPLHALVAAPPQTGVRGQTFFFQPGFATEVEPGIWVGVGSILLPWPTSFAILSAHSGREITHVATEADGTFEVSLPPGDYLIVPDARFGLAPTSSSFEVTVTARHFTNASIYYEPAPISFFAASL